MAPITMQLKPEEVKKEAKKSGMTLAERMAAKKAGGGAAAAT